jgi:hypothetical protein
MQLTNERVMTMVREEIRRHPEVTSPELFEKAKKLDRAMRSLTARQFNATYPLQVRRTLAPRRPRGRGPAGRSAASRDRVRGVLLEFARAVAGAQDRGALVEVIANLDQWVDRVIGGKVRGRVPENDGAAPVRRRARAAAALKR